MDVKTKDEINKKRRDSWFEVFFAIEALGINNDIVETSLKNHVEKMSKLKDIFIYEKEFKEMKQVKNPIKNVPEAFSQVVNVRFFAKDLMSLIGVVITYGPSAIEILGPEKKELKMGELQDLTNALAGLIHQFAAAGVGGIVITPEGKK